MCVCVYVCMCVCVSVCLSVSSTRLQLLTKEYPIETALCWLSGCLWDTCRVEWVDIVFLCSVASVLSNYDR